MDKQNNRINGKEVSPEELHSLLDDLLQSMREQRPAQPAEPEQPAEPKPAERPRPRFVVDNSDPADTVSRLILDDPEPEEEEEAPQDYAMQLIIPGEYDEEPDEEQPADDNDLSMDAPPPPPRAHRSPFAAVADIFRGNLLHKGDAPAEWIRKIVFWLSLVVLVASLGYLMYTVWLQPYLNERTNEQVRNLYNAEETDTITGDRTYPEGMLASFRALYDINPEVRGWFTYQSTGDRVFMDISYPVLYSGDNEKYLKTDFYGKKNKNGSLFFDERMTIEPESHDNKVSIIYGHNMASGQMFARLNKLIGNVYNARAAATMTMSTLYERNTYKVFAVLLSDEDETGRWHFNYRRMAFTSDEDFLSYVEELRAHSMFDYPVDVNAEDELLVLSTCTAYSGSKLRNGRVAVIARKVREGEGTAVNVNAIVKNSDVIMPRAWYANQKLELHPYYGGDAIQQTTTLSTGQSTTTTGSTGVTDPTTSGTTETDANGDPVTTVPDQTTQTTNTGSSDTTATTASQTDHTTATTAPEGGETTTTTQTPPESSEPEESEPPAESSEPESSEPPAESSEPEESEPPAEPE